VGAVPRATTFCWRSSLRELAGAIFVMSLGCNGVTSIEVERTSMAVIYDDDPLGDLDLPEFREIELFLGEYENEQGIRSKDITGANLERLVMTVIEPEGGDLSFANRIEIFVEAPDRSTRRIAHREDFPIGENAIEFDLDDTDLEPYITASSFTLRARVEGRPPPEDILVEGAATLDVGVTLAGVCHHM
jgi:hypothetical protein